MDSAPGERTKYGSVQYLLVAEATGPGLSIKGDKEFDITVHPGEYVDLNFTLSVSSH